MTALSRIDRCGRCGSWQYGNACTAHSAARVDRCPLCGAWRSGTCTAHPTTTDARAGDRQPRTRPAAPKPAQALTEAQQPAQPAPLLLDVDDWRLEARCRDHYFAQTDPWFDPDHDLNLLAAQICQSCPVRKQCLEDGLYEQHGIWGGWNPEQRRKLQKDVHATRNADSRDAAITRAALEGPHSLNRHNRK